MIKVAIVGGGSIERLEQAINQRLIELQTLENQIIDIRAFASEQFLFAMIEYDDNNKGVKP